MSKVILQNQGSVVAWKRMGQRILSGDGLPEDLGPGGSVGAFVTSIQVNDFDVTGKVICLNNRRILYEFGKGFGSIRIQGNLFIGPPYKGGSENLTQASLASIIDWFNQNRVSEKKESVTVTAGDHGTYTFVVNQFSIDGIETEFDLVSFSMTGDLVEMI